MQPTSEEEPAPAGIDLGETIVTATRREQPAFEAPYSTHAVEAREVLERAYRTLPQALREVPGVMVQETAHGHGSPYIRGFTSFRNVFLIDGIRLNNSVFRPGPNQYWNTVDPLSLSRLEVVKGPSSVLYGSDAIGGTVNAITKDPFAPYGQGAAFAGDLYYRVSSAEDSHIAHADVAATSADDVGFLLDGSIKHFGDLHGGDDTGEQPNTGYDEYDLHFEVERWLDANTRLVVAHQSVRQNDVPRTHRTVAAVPFEGTTVGSDLRRDLDQERDLTYVQLHGADAASRLDSYTLSLSWHDQEETRDRIRGSGEREMQGFDAETLGLFATLGSRTPIGRLTYGLDWYHDEVDSFSTGSAIQGPVADDATYDLLGLFVQDEMDVDERLVLTLGGRFQHAAADADSVEDPQSGERISLEDDWSALVGSARFLYRLVEDALNVFGGVSQGFRAPNLSDLTRFDTARTNEFEVPSPGLDPEHYVSYEVGLKARREDAGAQLAFFYTDIEDGIVRFPTGNTNAAGELEVTKANVGDGHVWGVELAGDWEVVPDWTLFGLATYLEGEQETFPDSTTQEPQEEYLSRLMPFTAELGLRWEEPTGRGWAEVVGVYADEADKLSSRDEGDTSRIPPGGTPGYEVLHLRGGWRLRENVALELALENVTDEDYRVHGSGLNRPGRNLIAGLRVTL